jgi:hypothetical protein
VRLSLAWVVLPMLLAARDPDPHGSFGHPGTPHERQESRIDPSAETVAAILGEPPDLDRLPATTPDRVRLMVDRCLRKDPRQRLHHADRDHGDGRSYASRRALTCAVRLRHPAGLGRGV